MLLLLQLSCPERGGRVAERPRWEGGQELVEGLLSKSTYRMSIVKSVIFIANCAGFKSGVYFSNHKLKTVWRSEMSFLAQRGEQPWDVLTVPNGVISFLLIPLWFPFLVLFCRENSG